MTADTRDRPIFWHGGTRITGTYAVGSPTATGWPNSYDKAWASHTGDHIVIGYQPAPLNPRARTPYEPHGWLIVLVDQAVAAQPSKLRRSAKAVA